MLHKFENLSIENYKSGHLNIDNVDFESGVVNYLNSPFRNFNLDKICLTVLILKDELDRARDEIAALKGVKTITPPEIPVESTQEAPVATKEEAHIIPPKKHTWSRSKKNKD